MECPSQQHESTSRLLHSTTVHRDVRCLCRICARGLPAKLPLGVCPACLMADTLDSSWHSSRRKSTVAYSPFPQNADCRFGNYELLDTIGCGGMGIVYRARKIHVDQIVALKIMLSEAHDVQICRQQFQEEVRILRELNHPNIVSIFEFGENNGQPYYSMDLVDGKNFAQLTQRGPIAAARAARYIAKVAVAVHYAHQQGVIHRDLKPSNILLRIDDSPIVADFGVALRAESRLNGAYDSHVGTRSYAAPEQFLGGREHIGPTVDVFALGAVLYHLLTGRPPFLEAATNEALESEDERKIVPPKVRNASVSSELESICLKCLEQDPTHRYESADALSKDLNLWLAHGS